MSSEWIRCWCNGGPLVDWQLVGTRVATVYSSSYLVLAVADALDIIVAASSGSAVVQEEYYYSC